MLNTAQWRTGVIAATKLNCTCSCVDQQRHESILGEVRNPFWALLSDTSVHLTCTTALSLSLTAAQLRSETEHTLLMCFQDE